ncbi:MAG: DUF4465 domain-containing protein [Rikenellaceae bacterium]
MKRFFSKLSMVAFAVAATVAFTSCSENNDDIGDGDINNNEENNETYELRVLTFEDVDYVGSGNYLGNSDWSSLIDSEEYGGEMLYGAYGWGDTEYNWYDEGNTELYSECITSWGTKNYGGGGHAISNYVMVDYDGANYTEQLSVSVDGGNNGSSNFCVHHGYVDASSAGEEFPTLSFKDDIARVVDHMYVVATSYLINYVTNGTGSYSSFADGHYLTIVATGYNGDVETGSLTFDIAKYDGSVSYTSDWTKWDLSSLGAVTSIVLNMEGNDTGEWGLNTPAYFAFDDVAVRFDL